MVQIQRQAVFKRIQKMKAGLNHYQRCQPTQAFQAIIVYISQASGNDTSSEVIGTPSEAASTALPLRLATAFYLKNWQLYSKTKGFGDVREPYFLQQFRSASGP